MSFQVVYIHNQEPNKSKKGGEKRTYERICQTRREEKKVRTEQCTLAGSFNADDQMFPKPSPSWGSLPLSPSPNRNHIASPFCKTFPNVLNITPLDSPGTPGGSLPSSIIKYSKPLPVSPFLELLQHPNRINVEAAFPTNAVRLQSTAD